MSGILRVPRRAALAAITVLVAASSFVSFGESYRGLFDWAREHGLAGPYRPGCPHSPVPSKPPARVHPVSTTSTRAGSLTEMR